MGTGAVVKAPDTDRARKQLELVRILHQTTRQYQRGPSAVP